jgi:hypothetical protein
MSDTNGQRLTTRTWAGLAGLMGLLGTVHSVILVPVLRSSVAPDINSAVQAHANIPHHEGAPSREEFTLIINHLNRIESRLDKLVEGK